jgi:hypothetical protein
MGLYNTAWLVIEEDPRIENNRTAAFELRNVDESASTQEPDYIMSGRGNFITQYSTFFGDETTFGVETTNARKRAGYFLDGGSGIWSETVSFKASDSSVPLVWGDERSDAGQANVTKFDASGSEIEKLTRRQVLDYWLAQTRSDSFANTRLHIGEYTDGSYPDYRDGEKVSGETSAGVYEAPIPVAVESTQLSTPEDQTSTLDGSITFQRVRTFPVGEDQLSDWTDNIPNLGTPLAPIPDA